MLTYQRPLVAQDDQDRTILTNETQAIIWAVGNLNEKNEPTYHTLRNRGNSSIKYPRIQLELTTPTIHSGDFLIDFGRSPFWNCPAPEEPSTSTSSTTIDSSTLLPEEEDVPVVAPTVPTPVPTGPVPAPPSPSPSPSPAPAPAPVPAAPGRTAPEVKTKRWFIPEIPCYEPENRVFYCHIGPAGGPRGYDAITGTSLTLNHGFCRHHNDSICTTGNTGWGISWYINGLLIPEVTVVRGETYTFVVEGGQSAERAARYHPFYITDDPQGGYGFKTPIERSVR